MYKNVIFDLDGTLLNTLEDLAGAANWVCAQHGWPAHGVEEYKYFVGNGAAKLLERVVPEGVPVTDGLRQVLLEEFGGTAPTSRTRPPLTPVCPRPCGGCGRPG